MAENNTNSLRKCYAVITERVQDKQDNRRTHKQERLIQAYFHRWIEVAEELDNGSTGNFTYALVEDRKSGLCYEAEPEKVKFDNAEFHVRHNNEAWTWISFRPADPSSAEDKYFEDWWVDGQIAQRDELDWETVGTAYKTLRAADDIYFGQIHPN